MIGWLGSRSRVRRVGVAFGVAVMVAVAGCTPGGSASSVPPSSAPASGSSAPVASRSSVVASPEASTPAPGAGMPGALAKSSMPPKDFASAPTFPQHLPEQVGGWEAQGGLNNDSGTIATYVKGADVISATWDFQDFGAYDLTVQAMTDAAYVDDLVCGADAAGLVMCLKVAKNGVLNVAGTEITSQDLAKIANEFVAGVSG